MKAMRWKIGVTVLWLVVLFNIERLDFDKNTTVNLASQFYVLAGAAALLILLFPMKRRAMYVLVAAIFAAYIVLKYISPVPVFQGVHKYLTITESIALLITMALTWMVNQGIRDFEQAVEAISLPKGREGVLEYDQFQERIRTELSRARRHQHPMSLAAIEVDPVSSAAALHRAVRDAQAALVKRYVQVQLGVFLTKNTRETDAVAHAEDGKFLLLAPETPGEQTENLLARLAHQVEEGLGLKFRYSIADFPKAALTSEELIHKATEKLRHESEETNERPAKREPAVATRTADT